ncbi:hypothetical protein CANCADRAFT_90102 [Tortispora caseinolytica NRRL Y-17796]|uniref:Uncharacterized protein n=1 Tax=Tortispora caseinolytica NRRL Y-17796 TaxID=767744 RepID=A0A1E4TLK7_9ASCO|nr:hypothetical protein CANCADRAFT_90102 [Tortispora caseinolytica NRRL Y-17796]
MTCRDRDHEYAVQRPFVSRDNADQNDVQCFGSMMINEQTESACYWGATTADGHEVMQCHWQTSMDENGDGPCYYSTQTVIKNLKRPVTSLVPSNNHSQIYLAHTSLRYTTDIVRLYDVNISRESWSINIHDALDDNSGQKPDSCTLLKRNAVLNKCNYKESAPSDFGHPVARLDPQLAKRPFYELVCIGHRGGILFLDHRMSVPPLIITEPSLVVRGPGSDCLIDPQWADPTTLICYTMQHESLVYDIRASKNMPASIKGPNSIAAQTFLPGGCLIACVYFDTPQTLKLRITTFSGITLSETVIDCVSKTQYSSYRISSMVDPENNQAVLLLLHKEGTASELFIYSYLPFPGLQLVATHQLTYGVHDKLERSISSFTPEGNILVGLVKDIKGSGNPFDTAKMAIFER